MEVRRDLSADWVFLKTIQRFNRPHSCEDIGLHAIQRALKAEEFCGELVDLLESLLRISPLIYNPDNVDLDHTEEAMVLAGALHDVERAVIKAKEVLGR